MNLPVAPSRLLPRHPHPEEWSSALIALAFVGCDADRVFDCSRLAAIEELPFRPEEGEDEVYRAVMSIEKKSRYAALLRCIDDTTPMEDSRQAPVYGGFVVGDAAVLLLSESTGIPIEEVLPDEVKGEWARQGIYSYFQHVSIDTNRRELKERWIDRLAVPAD